MRTNDLVSTLALVLVLAAGTRAAGEMSFSDVPASHPARSAVETVASRGIMQGFDGRFHGDKRVNRFQLAVIIKKVLEAYGLTAPPYEKDLPPDIQARHWGRRAVEVALGSGLMRASEEGRFQGDQLVRRYDLACFVSGMVRFLGGTIPGGETLPRDVSPEHEAADCVRTALGTGLMLRGPPGFDGEMLVDRIQVAQQIQTLARLFPFPGAASSPPPSSPGRTSSHAGSTEAMLAEFADELAQNAVQVRRLEDRVRTLQERNESLDRRVSGLEGQLEKVVRYLKRDGRAGR